MGTVYMIEDQIPEIKRNPWVDNFFRPLLITTMIMCFNYSLVNLAKLFDPTWRSIYFLAGMLLTTVEALYSYRVLKHWRSRGMSVVRYRLAEAIILVLLLKLLSFGNNSLAETWRELQELWVAPWTVVNAEFYVLLLLAAIAWISATNTIADFEALYDPYTFRSDRIPPLDDLATRFFWGGIVLVLISGVTQWIAYAGISSLRDFQRPSLNGIIINVLLYFILGLVLLSQANLTRLMVRWRVQKLDVPPEIVKSWGRYAFFFLALIGFIIFFIPTSYTLGFLDSAAIVVQLLLSIIVFLVQAILFLISLPLAWLLNLLSGSAPEQGQLLPTQPDFMLPPQETTSSSLPWYEAIRSLIFWLVGLAILGYFIKAYLDDHPEVLRALRNWRWFNPLLSLFRRLWQTVSNWAQVGLELLPSIIGPDEKGSKDQAGFGRGWFGFRRLSPREQVRSYYLNVLQQAADKHSARQANQTPYEYEPRLGQAIPEVQEEIAGLTEAFVQARYKRETVEPDTVRGIKPLWRRIKRALRRGRRKETDG